MRTFEEVLTHFHSFLESTTYLDVVPCRWGYVRLFNEGNPYDGIACHLATALKMAQKNRGPYSGTSVSLAFLMPSAVASITTSSFSFMEFRSTSMCFLQELDLAPPSA